MDEVMDEVVERMSSHRPKILLRGGYLFEYNGVLFRIKDRFLPTLSDFNKVEPIFVQTNPFEIVNGCLENVEKFQKHFGYFHFRDNCFYEKALTEKELVIMFQKVIFR